MQTEPDTEKTELLQQQQQQHHQIPKHTIELAARIAKLDTVVQATIDRVLTPESPECTEPITPQTPQPKSKKGKKTKTTTTPAPTTPTTPTNPFANTKSAEARKLDPDYAKSAKEYDHIALEGKLEEAYNMLTRIYYAKVQTETEKQNIAEVPAHHKTQQKNLIKLRRKTLSPTETADLQKRWDLSEHDMQRAQKISKADYVSVALINMFVSRAEIGQRKYGTNLDRKDLNAVDWDQHRLEELLDSALYTGKRLTYDYETTPGPHDPLIDPSEPAIKTWVSLNMPPLTDLEKKSKTKNEEDPSSPKSTGSATSSALKRATSCVVS